MELFAADVELDVSTGDAGAEEWGPDDTDDAGADDVFGDVDSGAGDVFGDVDSGADDVSFEAAADVDFGADDDVAFGADDVDVVDVTFEDDDVFGDDDVGADDAFGDDDVGADDVFGDDDVAFAEAVIDFTPAEDDAPEALPLPFGASATPLGAVDELACGFSDAFVPDGATEPPDRPVWETTEPELGVAPPGARSAGTPDAFGIFTGSPPVSHSESMSSVAGAREAMLLGGRTLSLAPPESCFDEPGADGAELFAARSAGTLDAFGTFAAPSPLSHSASMPSVRGGIEDTLTEGRFESVAMGAS